MAVPIFYKIFGLGSLMALIIVGGLAYFVWSPLPEAFDDVLELRANSVRSLVASWIKNPEMVNRDLPRAMRNLAANHHWVSGVKVYHQSREGNLIYRVHRTKDGNTIESGSFPEAERVHVEGEPPEDQPYLLSIQFSPDDARQHQRNLTWTLVFVGAGVIGLGGALAATLSWLIVYPIRRLRETTEEIQEGNLDVRAPVLSGDEIGDLARSFNVMIERLSSTLDSLRFQIQRRKDLLDQLYSAQDDERARIARELHDEIGPTLSAIRFELTNQLPDGSESPLTEQIQEVESTLRELSQSLHPSTLREAGLGEALKQTARPLKRSFDGTISTQILPREPLETLSLEERRMLYRAGQEALRNAVKHSQASQVSLIITTTEEGSVRLLVNDNGIGFDPEEVLDDKRTGVERGIGLASMRERMDLYGGSLTIETAPGEGTLVRIDYPLKGDDS